jgi:hypothetical protein
LSPLVLATLPQKFNILVNSRLCTYWRALCQQFDQKDAIK